MAQLSYRQNNQRGFHAAIYGYSRYLNSFISCSVQDAA
jgi:hypothetical protein